MTLSGHPIFVVVAVAVVAPLLAEIPIGARVSGFPHRSLNQFFIESELGG